MVSGTPTAQKITTMMKNAKWRGKASSM
jgi:hypothetical protein